MDFMTIPLPREGDQVLMEIFLAEDLSPESIRSLARCRGALEAIFLSDITTADGRYLEKFVFDPGRKKQRSQYKFPNKKPSNKDWNAWCIFWHNFTSTGDKLKAPLGKWTHPTHRIWNWYYIVQGDNLQRLEEGTVYHYRPLMGHGRTRTSKMYHLERKETYTSSVVLGLPTSV
jgi:hypothetical protein